MQDLDQLRYPLGQGPCLQRKGKLVRPGLQQGAGGLRHLPRMLYPGLSVSRGFGVQDAGCQVQTSGRDPFDCNAALNNFFRAWSPAACLVGARWMT